MLWEEKRREDRIRAEGYAVHRWVWEDLESFAAPAARLRAALGR